MAKKKTFSLRDFRDIAAALKSLGEVLTVGDEMKLEASVALLAEEPKQILALSGHELVESNRDAVMAILTALNRERDYTPVWRLQFMAASLLHWLYNLQLHPPAGWDKEPPDWPFVWEMEIRLALLDFVIARDSPEAERTRNARRKGGQVTASKRLDEKADLHTKIRNEAAKHLESYMRHESTAILAKKFHLSPSQIRRILKKNLPEN